MLTFLKKYININAFQLIWIISLISILANITILMVRFSQSGLLVLISDIIFIIASSILLLSLFSFNRVVLKVVLIINIFFLALSAYYLIFWALPFDDQIITAAIFSNFREATEVINTSIILFMVAFFLIPSILIVLIPLAKLNLKSYIKLLAINLIVPIIVIAMISYLVLNISVYPKALKNLAATYNPTGYIGAIGLSAIKISRFNDFSKLKPLPELFKFEAKKEFAKNLQVILIIGESSRSNHWQLNGYNKPTNPLLSKRDNLVSFTNVYSCYTSTWEAVLCLTGYKTRHEYFTTERKEQNIVSVFKHFGFNTMWISTSAMGRGVGVFAALGADVHIFDQNLRTKIKQNENIYDEVMFDDYEKFLNNKSDRKFIIVHTLGSHFLYPQRYPEKFSVLKPDCYNVSTAKLDSCPKDTKINAYDNSLIYTDYVIDTIIDKAIKTNKPTLVLYVSDHGQALGDIVNNQEAWGHGGQWDPINFKMKIHIPMTIYANKLFLDYYGKDIIKTMKLNKDKPISHDHVFNTLLDCIGIEGEVVRKNLSLCRKEGLNNPSGTPLDPKMGSNISNHIAGNNE